MPVLKLPRFESSAIDDAWGHQHGWRMAFEAVIVSLIRDRHA